MSCLISDDIITKSPTEVLLVSMDFTNSLISGDSLVSQSITSSSDLTISANSISGLTVIFTLAGGVTGNSYKIEITAVTTLGETLVGIGTLKVRD